MNGPDAPDLMVGGFDLVEHAAVTTTEAEKTLLSRPKISVRGRLATMLALFTAGSVAITVVMWVLLSLIDRKIELIGVADQLNYEILQARRFEKNFLLYGGDLEHVDYHIDATFAAMELSKEDLGASVSDECLEFLEVNLWHYRELIGKLRGLDRSGDPAETTARRGIWSPAVRRSPTGNARASTRCSPSPRSFPWSTSCLLLLCRFTLRSSCGGT